MGRIREKNITNKPTALKMKIGADFYSRKQIHCSMSNIQVLRKGSVTELLASPCTRRQNVILSWNPDDWKVVGSELSLAKEFEDIFCNATDNYNLVIPAAITFKEGMDICKHKLNNSNIPFQADSEQLSRYLAWHKNITSDVCSYIWTPFSDEQSEGTFLNMNSLTEVQPQLWVKDEPNGGMDENFVAIDVAQGALIDAPPSFLSCSSCLITTSLLLQLDGRCRHSLIGKFKHEN